MFLVVYIINTLPLTEWTIPWNSKEKNFGPVCVFHIE